MGSSYRVVTNAGEADWEKTDCYAAFLSFIQDCHEYKHLNGMRKARFLKNLGRNSEVDKPLKVLEMYIRHREELKVPFDCWYNMYNVLSNFPGTSPYIIKMAPKTMRQGNKEIGINLRHCPTHVAHLIMNIVRQYDEAWCPFMRQASRLFPILGANRSMLFLMMTQMMQFHDYRMVNHKAKENTQLNFGSGYEEMGHAVCAFKYGIPIGAVKEILTEGSLDYFFKNAEVRGFKWRNATFNDPEYGAIRQISEFYSPEPEHGELTLNLGSVPAPWKRKEFVNYFNQLKV